jgi:hypothetical protein
MLQDKLSSSQKVNVSANMNFLKLPSPKPSNMNSSDDLSSDIQLLKKAAEDKRKRWRLSSENAEDYQQEQKKILKNKPYHSICYEHA